MKPPAAARWSPGRERTFCLNGRNVNGLAVMPDSLVRVPGSVGVAHYRTGTCSPIALAVVDLPIPETVENRRRSIAMLPSGAPALNRDEALELLEQLKPRYASCRNCGQSLRARRDDGKHGCDSRRTRTARERGYVEPPNRVVRGRRTQHIRVPRVSRLLRPRHAGAGRGGSFSLIKRSAACPLSTTPSSPSVRQVVD